MQHVETRFRPMTDLRGYHGDAVGAAADEQQLRNRILELEDQLRRGPRSAHDATSEHAANQRLKVVATFLGATTVLMAPPAFVTLRRWIRWWRY
jgi:hypothetical protein